MVRVLAVGAHPDDVEILCAGTLVRYQQAGHAVAIAHLCSGDCGHFTIPPHELTRIRHDEAAAAAGLLGAELLTAGTIGDGNLMDNLPTRRRVVDLLRRARPQVILTHDPEDYMPDHRSAAQLVFAASFLAAVPHWDCGTNAPALERIPVVYHMDTLGGLGFTPEEYVDITAALPLKRRMLECHRSQVTWLQEHDGIDVVEFMTALARLRGTQCGVPYAEAFRRLRVWGRVSPERVLP